MANLAWGGYKNGAIPLTALVKVSNFVPVDPAVNARGAYLMPEAAAQWEQMARDCEKATKLRPTLSEGYRDLDGQRYRKQIQIRDGRPLAAAIGFSGHGWARSGDVGTVGRAWLRANSRKYGWDFTVISEDWHMDYLGNPTILASTALDILEDFMAQLTKDDMAVFMSLFLNTAAYTGGESISQVLKNLDVRTKSIYDAIFSGGDSMPDKVKPGEKKGYSIGQSLASIHEAITKPVVISRNGADPIAPLDGTKVVTRSKVDDDAETGTIVRRLLERSPVTIDAKTLADALKQANISGTNPEEIADKVADLLAERLAK